MCIDSNQVKVKFLQNKKKKKIQQKLVQNYFLFFIRWLLPLLKLCSFCFCFISVQKKYDFVIFSLVSLYIFFVVFASETISLKQQQQQKKRNNNKEFQYALFISVLCYLVDFLLIHQDERHGTFCFVCWMNGNELKSTDGWGRNKHKYLVCYLF